MDVELWSVRDLVVTFGWHLFNYQPFDNWSWSEVNNQGLCMFSSNIMAIQQQYKNVSITNTNSSQLLNPCCSLTVFSCHLVVTLCLYCCFFSFSLLIKIPLRNRPSHDWTHCVVRWERCSRWRLTDSEQNNSQFQFYFYCWALDTTVLMGGYRQSVEKK